MYGVFFFIKAAEKAKPDSSSYQGQEAHRAPLHELEKDAFSSGKMLVPH